MTLNMIEYDTPQHQAEQLAKQVAHQLEAAITARGRASLAVPGGTTPEAFLRGLSQAKLDWSKVSVTLSDERWVPEDNPRSNFALLRRTLAQHHAVAARFIPLYHPGTTPEEALSTIDQTLAAILPLDVCVLGMGADMHTASLFPGAEGLDQALDLANPLAVTTVRLAHEEVRITLNARVFSTAHHHYVLIKGKNKLAALHQAQQAGSVAEAPIRLILEHPQTTIHYTES